MDSFRWIGTVSERNSSLEKPGCLCPPTYAWQLPRVFREFIRTGSFQGSREAYFVMTCGGETGNAVRVWKSCALSRGLYSGAWGRW